MDGLTKSEELGKLMNAFASAHFDCGEHSPSSDEDYTEIWSRAVKAEKELLDFLEPYLPKD